MFQKDKCSITLVAIDIFKILYYPLSIIIKKALSCQMTLHYMLKIKLLKAEHSHFSSEFL